MRTEQEANLAIEKYADMVRRVCFIHLKNYHDCENVFQEVFLKYVLSNKEFENAEHEKAWLIRVAINSCKDVIKNFFRRNVSSIDLIAMKDEPKHIPDESREILDAVIRLEEKYRSVVYLHYYEGYTAAEIGKILKRNENTVYTWLSRARAELKNILGGQFDG